MGCPTSLWPTSYHSCKGHMKSPAPPLLPMEGGELPVKEQRASVVFSAAPASSAQPRACTAPPTTSHQISGRLWQPSLLPRCPPAWAPPILLRSSVSRCQEGRSVRSALRALRCPTAADLSGLLGGRGRRGGHTQDVAAPLFPHCFQVSICPHLRKSSVSKTQGRSCGYSGASSSVGFLPLVWASLSSSWSPEPPASLSPLPAFLRYRLGVTPVLS